MRHVYFIITFILLFFSKNSYAQLVNGAKSLGGYGNASTYLSKLEQPSSNSQILSGSLGFTPSYAVFKNNFLIGATLGSNFSAIKSENNTSTGASKWAYRTADITLNPFVRYYFKHNTKRAYFVFADVAYLGNLEYRKLSSAVQGYSDYDDNFNWRVGFGGHKVLTKNFVAEATIFYENNENIAFYASLRHFYTAFDKKNQEAPPQYIAKNRWHVSASISANNNYRSKDNHIGFYALAAKMLDNHFMVGSSMTLNMSGFSNSVNTTFGLAPFIRYYIPISSRLFAYPEIGANSSFYSGGSNSIIFSRGIGFQYFMTPNLALTCTTNGSFNNTKNGDNYSRLNMNALLGFGFSYFVK